MFAYYFPPENTSGATRPGQFVKYLPDCGYRTSVVSSSHVTSLPSEGVWRVPDPREPNAGVALAAKAAQLVQRCAAPYNDRLPWVPAAVSAGARILQSEDPPPIILSTSPPVAPHLAALWIHQRYRVKWIADFQDPLWGNPGRTRRLAQHYDSRIERMIFARADAVVANTEPVADLWRARYPRWSSKIVTIMNGFDPDDVFPSRPIAPRPYTVVAHVGALYGGRRPGPFLSAAERVIARGDVDPAKLRIRLIGPMEDACCDPGRPPFSTLAERGCLYRSPGVVPGEEARLEMIDADFLLLLDMNDLGASLQVPAKIYDYLRAGRPILAFTPRHSPTQQVLEQSGVTHVCVDIQQDPPERVDEALLRMLALPTESRPVSDWFHKTFDARNQTRKLADLMDRLVGNQPARRVA